MISIAPAVFLPVMMLGIARADQSPESERFDDAVFRAGLQSRGLLDLLNAHAQASPAGDPVEALLILRDTKLAEYNDPTKDADTRTAALDAANRALMRVIDMAGDDKRKYDWRLELAQSLIFQQAEPYTLNVLYRGGSGDDRSMITRVMDQAIRNLEEVTRESKLALAGLDKMTIAQFERLEESGFIEKLEVIEPQARYLMRWAKFYRAMVRSPHDPARHEDLEWVLTDLRDNSRLLQTPHGQSHAQAQSLLLAGMAARLLGNNDAAVDYLRDAYETTIEITDPQERQSLRWVATLSALECVKGLRDAGQFDRARKILENVREYTLRNDSGNIGLQIVIALLEGTVYEAEAKHVAAEGRPNTAQMIRLKKRDAMMELARHSDAYKQEIYRALYEQADLAGDVATLHPFDQTAVATRLVADADEIQQRIDLLRDEGVALSSEAGSLMIEERDSLLKRAIEIGEQVLENENLGDEWKPEVSYRVAVALYRMEKPAAATKRFLDVANRWKESKFAESAAHLAVQVGAQAYPMVPAPQRPEFRAMMLDALRLLLTRYASTEGAKYWWFFYGQALEEEGRLEEASEAYAQVDRSHPHYLRAAAFRARCMRETFESRVTARPGDIDAAVELFTSAARATQRAIEETRQYLAGDIPAESAATYRELLAESVLGLAEMYLIDPGARPAEALKLLDDASIHWDEFADLTGRVLRVRVIALESRGQFEEARRIIPDFIERAPQTAAATLQGLFEALRDEIQKARDAGNEEVARRKAESALLLAEQLHTWAAGARETNPNIHVDPYPFALQLAEAFLETGNWAKAREWFDKCAADDRAENDSRVIFGRAEALFNLGEYDAALPLFDRFFRESNQDDPFWWRALLRNLQTRHELGEKPADLIKVIEQQRYLHPRMGSDQTRAAFVDFELKLRASTDPPAKQP